MDREASCNWGRSSRFSDRWPSPRSGLAQTSGGSDTPAGPQTPAANDLQHNVATLAEVMRDIHQMLHLRPLTTQEAKQVSGIMARIGLMMKEMSGPQAEVFQSRHQRELQEMKTQLAEIKARLETKENDRLIPDNR